MVSGSSIAAHLTQPDTSWSVRCKLHLHKDLCLVRTKPGCRRGLLLLARLEARSAGFAQRRPVGTPLQNSVRAVRSVRTAPDDSDGSDDAMRHLCGRRKNSKAVYLPRHHQWLGSRPTPILPDCSGADRHRIHRKAAKCVRWISGSGKLQCQQELRWSQFAGQVNTARFAIRA